MRHYTRFLLCFLVLGLFLSFSDIVLYAQETAEETKQAEIDLVSDKAKASTVRLVGFSKRGSDLGLGGGTGFFIAPDKVDLHGIHIICHLNFILLTKGKFT